MPSSGYFASDYFSPYYFGSFGVPSPGDEGSPMAAFRDRDAFAAILQILQATGEFADIAFPALPSSSPVGADRTPLAAVVPVEWHETPDASSDAMLRRVTYNLVLIVRAEEPRDRFELIDRLTSVSQNALAGVLLGGFCMPGSSQLRVGRFDPNSRHPESRLAITATFSYLIDSPNDHSTAR